MELGALVCTPKSPQCPDCPVRGQCTARRRGEVDQLPNLGPAIATTRRRFAAFVAEHKGRLLVRQRPHGVVNAHLWEFPNLEVVGQNPFEISNAHQELGFTPRTFEPLLTIRHSITRYRITLDAFAVRESLKANSSKLDGHWFKPAELAQLSFPSAHKKILAALTR